MGRTIFFGGMERGGMFSRRDVHRDVRRDFPSVTARRRNNGNADDADLADCRGFARRDVHRDVRRDFPSVTSRRRSNGNADDADFFYFFRFLRSLENTFLENSGSFPKFRTKPTSISLAFR